MLQLIAELILFFIATSAANNANNAKALPLLTGFSLLTGFTLSGIVALAIGTIGIGSVGTAALATGITFVIASYTGQRMSDSVGQALSGVVGLGLIGLLIAMFVQLIGGFFAPGVFGGSGLELIIAGFGTVLFVAMSFVDFYTMPRRYNDDQYLAGALGMYLTYINLICIYIKINDCTTRRWKKRLKIYQFLINMFKSVDFFLRFFNGQYQDLLFYKFLLLIIIFY